jgi:hypothetical protein
MTVNFHDGNCEMVKTCRKNEVNIITMLMVLNKWMLKAVNSSVSQLDYISNVNP